MVFEIGHAVGRVENLGAGNGDADGTSRRIGMVEGGEDLADLLGRIFGSG